MYSIAKEEMCAVLPSNCEIVIRHEKGNESTMRSASHRAEAWACSKHCSKSCRKLQ
jgi:hypothetical protein